MWNRRQVLAALGGSTLAAVVPTPAFAVPQPGRKFVFVFARGGWDITRVHSPSTLTTAASVEPDATVGSHFGLDFVKHPDRPAVSSFFRDHGHRTAIIEGMLVRSVNHKVCERLILTGSSAVGASDWPTILGAAWADRMPLPNLVLGGPSEAGDLGRFTSIAGGEDQLKDLLQGSSRLAGDQRPTKLRSPLENAVDTLARQRAAAQLASAGSDVERRMLDAWVDGHDRGLDLRDQADGLDITGGTFQNQAATAVTLLQAGLARCVCISQSGWDSHSTNDETQTGQFNTLFGGLSHLMERLESAEGHSDRLSQETTVVVISEMGRAPYLNSKYGKDHWPYTAVMLMGSGIFGGRRLGGVDEVLNGRRVRLDTGALDDSGVVPNPDNLGATLLTLGGVDPGEWLPGAEPMRFVMA